MYLYFCIHAHKNKSTHMHTSTYVQLYYRRCKHILIKHHIRAHTYIYMCMYMYIQRHNMDIDMYVLHMSPCQRPTKIAPSSARRQCPGTRSRQGQRRSAAASWGAKAYSRASVGLEEKTVERALYTSVHIYMCVYTYAYVYMYTYVFIFSFIYLYIYTISLDSAGNAGAFLALRKLRGELRGTQTFLHGATKFQIGTHWGSSKCQTNLPQWIPQW